MFKFRKFRFSLRSVEKILFLTIFTVMCVFIFFKVLIAKTCHNYTYIEGTPFVPETQVIIKEIVPENMTVNINTATIEELMTLDGIGEVTAGKIIEYRENNNGFLTVDELLKVDGIGEAKLEKIRSFITTE